MRRHLGLSVSRWAATLATLAATGIVAAPAGATTSTGASGATPSPGTISTFAGGLGGGPSQHLGGDPRAIAANASTV